MRRHLCSNFSWLWACEYKRKWVSFRVLKSMDKWWIDQEADAGEAKNQQVVTLLFQITNYFSNWKVYHNHYMRCGSDSSFHNAIVLPYNDGFTQKISNFFSVAYPSYILTCKRLWLALSLVQNFGLFLGIFHGKFNDFFGNNHQIIPNFYFTCTRFLFK
jgi:hypothetical protein